MKTVKGSKRLTCNLMNQSITSIYETVSPLKRFISFSLKNLGEKDI